MNINELEQLRRRIRSRNAAGMTLSVIVGVILCFVNIMIGVFVIILGITITAFSSAGLTRKFNLEYKDTFVKKALEDTFTDLVYLPERGLDKSVIASTQMMYMGDRYSANDYISGKYKDIRFSASDIHIEEEYESTDMDGDTTTRYDTIFKGQWFIFDFNKTFKYNLQVRQVGFTNARLNNFFTNTKYKRVEMEDQKFNNMFKIYAQSEHEAFYILTPHLMEKIENLVNSIKGSVLLCFIDNKLHVGINSKSDSFEHNMSRALNEEEIVRRISKDIKVITSFVDELDLDNNLFRKEV